MIIYNTHERTLTGASPERAGELIEGLGTPGQVWPADRWPALHLPHPVQPGTPAGHGSIRYTVQQYVPRVWIRFRFTRPRDVDGFHEFSWYKSDTGPVLRHDMVITTRGLTRIAWPLAIRWLHDALLEDLMDQAELAATGVLRNRPARWSVYVRLLRRITEPVRQRKVQARL